MSVATNKRIVLAFAASMSRGEPDETLLCDDVRWWVPGMGLLDRAQFFALADAFYALVEEPGELIVQTVTAEDDRVAVEASMEARLKDGRTYANTYHFLFHLRDGRIREVREHNDSAVPAALFGGALRADGAPG